MWCARSTGESGTWPPARAASPTDSPPLPSEFTVSCSGGYGEAYPPRQVHCGEAEGFWYRDVTHFGDSPLYPLDAYFTVSMMDLAQSYFYTRYFAMPTSGGRATLLVMGRVFRTSYPPRGADLAEFERRLQAYLERWDERYEEWKTEVLRIVDEMRRIPTDLPQGLEDICVVEKGGGFSPYAVLEGWMRLYTLWLRLWFKHYEFLMVGYLLYHLFHKFLKTFFPNIPEHHVIDMLRPDEMDIWRPHLILKRLADRARELGLEQQVLSAGSAKELEERLAQAGEAGALWLAEWEAAKYPWFYISTAAGFHHWEERWINNLDIPLTLLKRYIREGPGEPRRLSPDELAARYAELLPEEVRRSFWDYLHHARKAFRYIEEHSFYVEHLGFTVGYGKVRDYGRLLKKLGVLDDAEDIFLLRWDEVFHGLLDGLTAWANGTEPRLRLREVVHSRRLLLEELRRAEAPPHLGAPPEDIRDSNLVMLHRAQARATPDGALAGVPASPGRARGVAVVVRDAEDLKRVGPGAVAVVKALYPSWLSALAAAAGIVAEAGGVLSHTAIVARELGKPAVVAVEGATEKIREGTAVEVDGYEGLVYVR
jgi:pyruvate,water dikinase